MKIQQKISDFKEATLRGESATLKISPADMEALNREFCETYCAILSSLSFLEKNWLSFVHYEISTACIMEISGWP